jgi:hypothetical protein
MVATEVVLRLLRELCLLLSALIEIRSMRRRHAHGVIIAELVVCLAWVAAVLGKAFYICVLRVRASFVLLEVLLVVGGRGGSYAYNWMCYSYRNPGRSGPVRSSISYVPTY